MQNHDDNPTIYGGFFVRLAAYLVDLIISGLALVIIKLPMFFVKLGNPDMILVQPFFFNYSVWDIFIYLLATSYFIILTYTTGATLGKRLFNLKVVSADGEKLSLLDVIYRETIGRYLCSVIIYVGYLLVGLDKEKKGLHDMLCDTRVIYTVKMRVVQEPIVPYVPNVPRTQKHSEEFK